MTFDRRIYQQTNKRVPDTKHCQLRLLLQRVVMRLLFGLLELLLKESLFEDISLRLFRHMIAIGFS